MYCEFSTLCKLLRYYKSLGRIVVERYIRSFIELMKLHKEPLANGQIFKSTHFRISEIMGGNPMEEVNISVPTENATVETVALLTKEA